MPRTIGLVLKVVLIQVCLFALADSVVFAEQIRFKTLRAGDVVYHDVRVREVSAKWIVILHSGGIAQIALPELSPELQVRFGYSPERAKDFDDQLQEKRLAERKVKKSAPPPVTILPDKPEADGEVDLRDRYFGLGLYTKNQGRRPSCAVFAILGVMEFHYSLRSQGATFLSEEFLVWATRQINPRQSDLDGFTFGEVAAAIQHYGVARSHVMPNTLGVPFSELVANEEALADAMDRRDVSIHFSTGSKEAKIDSIIYELNEGFPVAVALRWPPSGVVAGVHTLRDQHPQAGGGHAVTIVGYHRPKGAADEVLFLFRNSYGIDWGMGGYGYVSDRYLKEHLYDVLTVRLEE